MVVYTSDHEGSLSTLSPAQVARVVALWRDRCAALWAQGHDYVMAFENHGVEVGATLSHPHGQIYALPFLPPATIAKVAAIDQHRRERAGCLGCELVAADAGAARDVVVNDSFTVAVPFAARWPFEVHVRARRHGCGRLGDLTDGEAVDLARAIRSVTARYDGLFGRELPYMLCVQEAPAGSPDWHLHVELLPPHRDEHRLKIRASVETALGLFLNDTLPEESAQRLAAVRVDDGSWSGVFVPADRPDHLSRMRCWMSARRRLQLAVGQPLDARIDPEPRLDASQVDLDPIDPELTAELLAVAHREHHRDVGDLRQDVEVRRQPGDGGVQEHEVLDVEHQLLGHPRP